MERNGTGKVVVYFLLDHLDDNSYFVGKQYQPETNSSGKVEGGTVNHLTKGNFQVVVYFKVSLSQEVMAYTP